jgi:hypothetical protein
MKKQKNRGQPKLLLHTCCADCAVKAVTYLNDNMPELEPILYFDNSNIHPRTEFLARQKALKKIAQEHELEIIGANWSPKVWFKAIDYKQENKHLGRCKKCWALRLKNTAEKAAEMEIPNFSTTLLTSHYQSHEIIGKICKNIAKQYKLEFIFVEPPCGECNPIGFYKQNYCGCIYSLKGRYEQKFMK